jgi:ribulose-bisphosphate carboxylase large chain
MHPYIGKPDIATPRQRRQALVELNAGRGSCRGAHVAAVYYFEVGAGKRPLDGLVSAGRMALEHGTLKPWHSEGDHRSRKPSGYDGYMGWATDVQLLRHNQRREAGLITLAYPLTFFDKRDDRRFPLATLLEAVASEPVSAFTPLRAARLVDLVLPASLTRRCLGQRWPHRRVRQYLGLADGEPIIGTIVKPKTGLTPELFSRCVVEAALAGAVFTKADENMHLTLREIPRFVGRVARDLKRAGFDLGHSAHPRGKRFLFAPHITTDADRLREHARAAIDAGANALMFTPYYAGGFRALEDIAAEFDVPVYAHTAGMNMLSGCTAWGIDSRIFYVLAGLFGAAFMQLPTMGGYIRPFDEEKPAILAALRKYGLEGDDGMTLVIAGGLGPDNISRNMRLLGSRGRMFLAGTSVYSHPDGPTAGVKALVKAYRESAGARP